MTQPTVVFLGPDGGAPNEGPPRLKVFLRTLLFSTSVRGQIVESMHVNVQRGETRQNFSIWVYGDKQLSRGSGLHVGPEGVACNHHFLLPEDGASFALAPGQYVISVFAKRVQDPQPRRLQDVRVSISEIQADQLRGPTCGVYFDWGPDQQAYHSHIEDRPPKALPKWLLEAASEMSDGGSERS